MYNPVNYLPKVVENLSFASKLFFVLLYGLGCVNIFVLYILEVHFYDINQNREKLLCV